MNAFYKFTEPVSCRDGVKQHGKHSINIVNVRMCGVLPLLLIFAVAELFPIQIVLCQHRIGHAQGGQGFTIHIRCGHHHQFYKPPLVHWPYSIMLPCRCRCRCFDCSSQASRSAMAAGSIRAGGGARLRNTRRRASTLLVMPVPASQPGLMPNTMMLCSSCAICRVTIAAAALLALYSRL